VWLTTINRNYMSFSFSIYSLTIYLTSQCDVLCSIKPHKDKPLFSPVNCPHADLKHLAEPSISLLTFRTKTLINIKQDYRMNNFLDYMTAFLVVSFNCSLSSSVMVTLYFNIAFS
jgi:hypothetical protein